MTRRVDLSRTTWLLVLLVATIGASCRTEDIAIRGKLAKDNALEIELENTSEKELIILDKPNLEFYVVKIYVLNPKGQSTIALKSQTDWLAFPEDCKTLKPKEKV